MNSDFYTYATEMKAYLEKQAHRMAALEAEVEAMKQQVSKLSAQPPVNIERIEYKFDQLKIERLDGTLNIGLNPADLKELDDITVQNQPYPIPFPKFLRDEINQAITTYMEQDLPDVITEIESQIVLPNKGEYHSFIIEDLRKQLHDRIEYYIQQHPYTDQQQRNGHYKNKIIEQIKTDIEQAVRTFLMNVSNEMKGK